MPTSYTVRVLLDDAQVVGVSTDRVQHLFTTETNEEYLAVRLLEIVDRMTQQHVYDPEEQAAVAAVRAARQRPQPDHERPPVPTPLGGPVR